MKVIVFIDSQPNQHVSVGITIDGYEEGSDVEKQYATWIHKALGEVVIPRVAKELCGVVVMDSKQKRKAN